MADSYKLTLVGGLFAIIDTVDRDRVEALGRWYVVVKRRRSYVRTVSEPCVYLHHLIAGKRSKLHVDHKNGDGLDNRRENPRHATVQENIRNAGKSQGRNGKPTSSVYKGVYADNRMPPLAKPLESLNSCKREGCRPRAPCHTGDRSGGV